MNCDLYLLEYMALNEKGGELFKNDFRKLLSLEWKYFKKTLTKNSVFQNIKQKHNTGKKNNRLLYRNNQLFVPVYQLTKLNLKR